jgi:methylated-DNA-[protein]-cysteine S-methyltransferase
LLGIDRIGAGIGRRSGDVTNQRHYFQPSGRDAAGCGHRPATAEQGADQKKEDPHLITSQIEPHPPSGTTNAGRAPFHGRRDIQVRKRRDGNPDVRMMTLQLWCAVDGKEQMKDFLIDRIESPIGVILIACDGSALCALDFGEFDARMGTLLRRRHGAFNPTSKKDPLGVSTRVAAYLDGDLRALDKVKVAGGGTPFQERVWAALRKIPPGTTTTYGALAASLGVPTATRAVGAANGQNPNSIVVPCHRVIGADGTLTGYGGGLARKRWLLEHEGIRFPT